MFGQEDEDGEDENDVRVNFVGRYARSIENDNMNSKYDHPVFSYIKTSISVCLIIVVEVGWIVVVIFLLILANYFNNNNIMIKVPFLQPSTLVPTVILMVAS